MPLSPTNRLVSWPLITTLLTKCCCCCCRLLHRSTASTTASCGQQLTLSATVTSASTSASAARGVARFVAPLTWQHVAPAGGPPGYHLLCSLSWGRLRPQSLLISLLNMLALICHSESCLLLLLLLIMFGLGHYIDLIQPNPAPKSY